MCVDFTDLNKACSKDNFPLMYVDFTDLNKACSKDNFPLPRINQVVDSTAGHKLLTFMDVFSIYNQIKMVEENQEKTAFITSQ